MADQLQLRRGTTSEMLLFTGAQGEVVVDTDKNTVVVQDGATAGGYPLARSEQIDDGTFFYNENVGSAANAYILDAKPNTNTPSAYMDGVQFGFVTAFPNTGPATANFQSLGVKNLKFPGGVDPQAGDISGRMTFVYDAANGWLEIQRKSTQAPPQLRTVSASVGTNALTVGLQPAIIDFRASSLGSGTINRRTVAAALSLVVPAGATLGTQSGVQSQIAILAIDNAGTVQLAVANIAGNTNFDETTLLTTVAITSGSNSANVVYAASAVAGVPFRVVGYVQSTQTVAGTWSTVPSVVQGQGGQTIVGVSKITQAVSQATTSGTAIDFTGIPPGTKRITLMLSGVSTSGTSNPLIQIGSGSVTTTGYVASSAVINGASAAQVNYTAGFGINTAAAANVHYGQIILSAVGAGNVWTCQGTFATAATGGYIGGGIPLSGTLDRVRLTTVNGTDTFDLGVVNIIYEG